MSFYTSLSGLQASQAEMSTISHNLANVSTNGFKKSRTEFADVMASSVSTSPTKMIGSGVVVQANRQQFGQGNMIESTSGLSLAITGSGFFAVKPSTDGATVNFSRNGGFLVNEDRYVVDGSGGHLQVYPVDGSGQVVATGLDQVQSLRLPETSGTAIATGTVGLTVNLSSSAAVPANAFDRFDPRSYNQSTSTTVYDALGQAQTMTTYFRRESVPGNGGTTSDWKAYSFVGDTPMKTGGVAGTTMTFDADGKMTAPTAKVQYDEFTPPGAGTAQQIALDLGVSTQLAKPFNVAVRSQDGKSIGKLEGVTVDEKGLVQASFSNGDVQTLGKVVMANFANPTGLRQLGSSYWSASGISGEPILGGAGEDGMGKLLNNTIERSNVDITEELVGLIAAQRNFQANAKALDTASQISQTIFNIRS